MRKLLTILLFLSLSAPWCALGGHGGVSVILSADISPYRQAFEGFRGAVQEKNGATRLFEHNLASEGDGVMERIVSEHPLLVFAVGPEAAKFARERIKNVPVVFAMVLNAESLAGANVTGVSLEIPVRAKLERIRKIIPDAKRIGVVYSPAFAPQYREVAQQCRALGLQAVGREIPSGKELHEAFDGMVEQMDLFLMIPDAKIYFPKSIEHLLMDGLKHRVPIVGLASSYTRAGAIVSFEADYADLGRQAGEMALRIADGEKPSRIEPARPKRVKMSINLVVAERLGIGVPPEVLREASDVYR
jgi:putative ABC transport system substrate-binding protein